VGNVSTTTGQSSDTHEPTSPSVNNSKPEQPDVACSAPGPEDAGGAAYGNELTAILAPLMELTKSALDEQVLGSVLDGLGGAPLKYFRQRLERRLPHFREVEWGSLSDWRKEALAGRNEI
jgi:hypothetical protein